MNDKRTWDRKRKRFYNLKGYGIDVAMAVTNDAPPGRLGYLFDKAEQCRHYFGMNSTCQAKCAFYLVCVMRSQTNSNGGSHVPTAN